jgi:hypothetical protein
MRLNEPVNILLNISPNGFDFDFVSSEGFESESESSDSLLLFELLS